MVAQTLFFESGFYVFDHLEGGAPFLQSNAFLNPFLSCFLDLLNQEGALWGLTCLSGQ
jgi:hypothetical protein